MYIAQWLARHTSHSRRSAVELIKAGRVQRNGNIAAVTDQAETGDIISVDNETVQPKEYCYLMLNKPVGYVCSRKAQDERPTVYALLPEIYQHVSYAGRLDADSSGLLLMSNDGDWIQKLTHPRNSVTRIYHVELNRDLSETDRTFIKTGVKLDDGPSALTLSGKGQVWRIELQEGRNRQIRRTFESLGYTVTKLHRSSHGQYSLDQLGTGKFIEINR